MQKTEKIVFHIQKGLYLYYHGYTPLCKLADFSGDLTEILRDLPWDRDTAPNQGRDLPRYRVQTITLPLFLKNWDEYISQFLKVRDFGKYLNLSRLDHQPLTPAHARKLWQLYLDGDQKTVYIITRLLEVKRPRSEFRKSLIGQIWKWLDDPQPKYRRPLSPRQMSAVMRYEEHNYHCISKARVGSYLIY